MLGFMNLKKRSKGISVEPVSFADWHGSCFFARDVTKAEWSTNYIEV